MGLFGFVSEIASAAVKVVITPFAVTKDIIDGEPFETTSDLLESAGGDIENSFDELTDFFE